jgi:hypothetical protein
LLGSHRATASHRNYEPLSLRIRSGAPSRSITRPSTRRTSGAGQVPIDVQRLAPQVYSPSSVSRFSGWPSLVWSATKS